MPRLLILVTACSVFSHAAFASEPLKQIRGCMLQRMNADRLLSYNDAKKACLDALKEQGGLIASSSSASKRAAQPISAREASGLSN